MVSFSIDFKAQVPLCRLGNVTILQKGPADRVSDGETARSFGEFGSPRRVGGQGDIMTGR
jgi:ATP-dependent NAD(P)H-hydrate dehydratase